MLGLFDISGTVAVQVDYQLHIVKSNPSSKITAVKIAVIVICLVFGLCLVIIVTFLIIRLARRKTQLIKL